MKGREEYQRHVSTKMCYKKHLTENVLVWTKHHQPVFNFAIIININELNEPVKLSLKTKGRYSLVKCDSLFLKLLTHLHTYTHIHTHTHAYIYIYI